MKPVMHKVILMTTGILFPFFSYAQTYTGEIRSMQAVLDELYKDMLPLCSQLIGVGRGIAAFAALWYIASRIWRSLANAEPIDFYPLLRPFAIGMAIMLFPYVIALMNEVLQPTVTGTAAMVRNSNLAIEYLLKQKEDALQKTVTGYMVGDQGSFEKWSKYTNPEGEEQSETGFVSSGLNFLMAKAAFNLKNSIKQWLSEILQLIYEAAALCINTLRTFYLIVLAILGPLVFGLSVFDGLRNTLMLWIARYVNVFLWLPVANIFGSIIAKIQENMLRIDIKQIEMYGDTFFSSADTAYIIFLIIGIVGYFTVPSVANYIVHAGGENVLLHKTSNVFTGTATSATSSAGAAMGNAGSMISSWLTPAASGQGSSQGQDNKPSGNSSQFMHDKLSGNK